jgi:uroporphyrinogen decarboxylase
MTRRERTLACLRGEPTDRLPLVHFGFWRETLLQWVKEGHLTREQAEAYTDGNDMGDWLSGQLGFDHAWACVGGGNWFLDPAFERKVIRELPGGGRHVLNPEGVVELEVPGATSIPAEIDHLLQDRESWEAHYLPRLQWRVERAGGIPDPVPDRPHGLWCGSLIGNVRNILGVEGLAYMQMDDPELLTEIIDTCAGLCLRGVEEMLQQDFTWDFAHFWEDICYNHGPLVQPSFFAEQVKPWYARITDLLRSHGVAFISVDCDGCIDHLLPHWLDAGVNVMFPIEVGTWNASIAPWREQYGPGVLGVGGMRKQVFSEDRAAVDKEIERLKPLIDLGGYIPCPDHRIPPGSKWELVQYYTDQLRGL